MSDPNALWSPLEPGTLTAAAGPQWTVRLLDEAESTNALAAAEPRTGLVLVADHQTAGRGRLDRSWETPAGTSLTFSVVVDPSLEDARWPLLPLATALAVAAGVRRAAGVEAGVQVKWPNDILVGDLKVSGLLLERVMSPTGPVAVIGIGINVHQTPDQLPVPTATSLAIEGSDVGRTEVFAAVLDELGQVLERLAADPVAVLAAYRSECVTLGAEVEVRLPDGEVLQGTATDIDDEGRLVVAGRSIGAGDVVHVRPGAR